MAAGVPEVDFADTYTQTAREARSDVRKGSTSVG